MSWIVERLKEPSTWAGTGIIAILLSQVGLDDETAKHVLQIGAAVGGLLSIYFREQTKS